MGKLTTRPVDHHGNRADYIVLCSAKNIALFGDDWSGYAGFLCLDDSGAGRRGMPPGIRNPRGLDYLSDDDVIQLLPSGVVRVLFRKSSRHNTILVTEQCNSYCLMCSQPPRAVDDSERVALIHRLLALIDPGAPELILSGGEPTLFGDGFLSIVREAKHRLPATGLHVLTNGRRFENSNLAAALGAIQHHDLMLGIPLYSDVDHLHDYVVQAHGAYGQTVLGLYNLSDANVRLEIRVVVHKQTFERLPRLAEFIARNLPFVEQVALMGLEMFGFAPLNAEILWTDPFDYAPYLEAATLALSMSGIKVLIYNHQLCTIPRTLWPFARKAISDWKNVYVESCATCEVRPYCGGFFQSGTKRISAHVAPQTGLGETTIRYLDLMHASL